MEFVRVPGTSGRVDCSRVSHFFGLAGRRESAEQPVTQKAYPTGSALFGSAEKARGLRRLRPATLVTDLHG